MLLILIIILGYGQLLRFDFSGVPVYLHDIIVFLYLALNIRSVSVAIWRNSHSLIFRALTAGLVLSSSVAVVRHDLSSLFVPGLYLLRLVSYLLFALLLSDKTIEYKKYLHIAPFVALVIGILQYLFLKDMRYLFSLGWDDHLDRIIMPFYDPTFTGAFLSIGAIYAYESKKKLLSILYLPWIILTYARSVWLSLIATLFLTNKKITLAIFIFSTIILLLIPKGLGEGTNLLRTYSISSRLEHDLSLISKHKWDLFLGVGYNSFALNNSSHSKGANSSYLQIMLTTGLIGLIGVILLLKQVYQNSLYRKTLIFVLFASLFNNVLMYPPITLYLILIFTSQNEV